jgi:cyclin A
MEKYQPEITWTMRMILMDWMMEVCAEFTMKRQTYHLGVAYVDKFLSVVEDLPKS